MCALLKIYGLITHNQIQSVHYQRIAEQIKFTKTHINNYTSNFKIRLIQQLKYYLSIKQPNNSHDAETHPGPVPQSFGQLTHFNLHPFASGPLVPFGSQHG